MNREHCKAIMANIDLIRHYAEGGDIGHRLMDCAGKQIRISPARGINLGGLHAEGTLYVRVKNKYRKNPDHGHMERVERSVHEKLQDHEIITGKETE